MKKKILWGLVAIVAIAGIGLGILIANINPILESYRPKLTQSISDAIGQPVELGEIEVQFFPSISIGLQDVALVGSEANKIDMLLLSTNLGDLLSGNVTVETFTLKNLSLTVTKKKDGIIYVGKVPLNAPEKKVPTPTTKTPQPKKGTQNKESSASLELKIKNAHIDNGLILFIDQSTTPEQKINISNVNLSATGVGKSEEGQVELTASLLGTKDDNISAKGSVSLEGPKVALDIALTSLDLKQINSLVTAYGGKIEGLSLEESMDIKGSFSMGKDGIKTTINLNGSPAQIAFAEVFKKATGDTLKLDVVAQPGLNGDVVAKQVTLSLGESVINLPTTVKNGVVSATVSTKELSLKDLSKYVPPLKEFSPGGSINANVNVRLEKTPIIKGSITTNNVSLIVPGDKPMNITNTKGEISFEGNRVIINPLTSVIAGVPAKANVKINLNEKDIEITPSLINIFEGSINLGGKFGSDKAKTFSTTIKANGLNLNQVSQFAATGSSYGAEGTLENLSLQANGALSNLLPTLSSTINFLGRDGSITGFNLLGQTLKGINGIPGVEDNLAAYVPEKHRGVLTANSTAFDTFTGDLSVVNQNASIKILELRHALYIVTANGRVQLGGDIRIEAELKLTPVMTEDMILRQPKLKLLLDKEGNMAVPIVIKVTDGSVIVKPDVKKLLKRAAKNTAKEAISRELDKVAPGLGGVAEGLGGLFK